MASSPSNMALYAQIRTKAPLAYKIRKALLSHWTPKIAKAICHGVYPDFRGTYEQNLWLLTHKATESVDSALCYDGAGYTSYACEAKEKGVLFLWPYTRIEDTRLCAPSHYMYYILKWERLRVNAVLSGGCIYRRSARLNAKQLVETLRLHEVYVSLPGGAAACKERQKALAALVKSQLMLTANNQIEFKAIAYGWTHLRKHLTPAAVSTPATALSPAAMTLVQMDAELQARRR